MIPEVLTIKSTLHCDSIVFGFNEEHGTYTLGLGNSDNCTYAIITLSEPQIQELIQILEERRCTPTLAS